MPVGLLRDNNLSDLPDRQQALRNLGFSDTAIRNLNGVAFPGGVRAVDIQRISNSSGNYQGQLDGFNINLNSINFSQYVLRAGDTISGTWTNYGRIQARAFYANGVVRTPSTDSVFSHNRDGQFELTTATINYNRGVSTVNIADFDNAIMSGVLVPNKIMPVQINGVSYNLETVAL
jgi:hypothetical protein